MLVAFTVAVAFLAAAFQPTGVHAQETGAAGARTFKAELYHVAGGSKVSGLTVEHVPVQTPEKLGIWLEGDTPHKLQALTVAPGQENAVVKYKDLTFRISGLYRGPQKDRMFLKVSFDQGGQAAVKEFLAGLDQSVVVTYPLAGEEGGSIVILLVPTS